MVCVYHHIASHGLSEAQRELQRTAFDFAQNELRPHMREWDEEVGDTDQLIMD